MFMSPAFVTRRRTLRETDHFLGLDLGGTNFRTVLCRLQGRDPQIRFFSWVFGCTFCFQVRNPKSLLVLKRRKVS